MCNVSTRLDALNRRLVAISKLQTMEGDYDSYATCKKCSLYSDIRKCCYCAKRIQAVKEQCAKSCAEGISLYDKPRKRVPCNSETCKTRRKLNARNSFFAEDLVPVQDLLIVQKEAQVTRDVELVHRKSQQPERQSKSDQVDLTSEVYREHTKDKIVDTYEEKGEQTVPTRDPVSGAKSVRHEQATSPDPDEIPLTFLNEGVSHEGTETVCAKDRELFEKIQKELLNQKKRCEELQTKLDNLTCSLDCLKEDSEQRAACLKGALETAEEQKRVAMDLMERSKAQADVVKGDREQLSGELARLQRHVSEMDLANKELLEERQRLTTRLQSLSEDESKRCEELEREMNNMKSAVKEKEEALNKEKMELREMILELSNVVNIQKRRICEVTCICNNQQQDIQKKEMELVQKNEELQQKDEELQQKDEKLLEKDAQLVEVKDALKANNASVEEMEEKIHELAKCLCEEVNTCDCVKRELEAVKEQYSCHMRIKEKIIEDQTRTISKQKKLLHDSEEMIQQVASDFDQMKEELHVEREKNVSLQVTLGAVDDKLHKVYSSPCDQCKALMNEIAYLNRVKQRAVAFAKFAYQKLQQCTKEYRRKICCERKRYRYMALIMEKKDHEIGCLKNQLCQSRMGLA